MIPADFINEWRQKAPWTQSDMVEQDLIISKAIVELFNDEYFKKSFAFRGGTAFSKLFAQRPLRYSEDIDLVQIRDEPIGESLTHIRSVLDPWLGAAQWAQKKESVKLYYRFTSNEGNKLRLKIEINTTEPFTINGFKFYDFGVDSPWFTGASTVCSFGLEELMATKLRALFQRNKSRDLFDIWIALTQLNLSSKEMVEVFCKYNEHNKINITKAQFEKNLFEKKDNFDFKNDMNLLLPNGVKWVLNEAYEKIMTDVVSLIPGERWKYFTNK